MKASRVLLSIVLSLKTLRSMEPGAVIPLLVQ